ncbi:MAG: pentapeptide repeat-containing protein [Burkholderiales bacterium]|nr:pentapeptide repeat-containing protein [Burkholderiales bacterium]
MSALPPPSELVARALARFAPLRPAERLMVRACAAGEIAKVGLKLPEGDSAEVNVRASLLAFILRGGLGLRGQRLQLVGAAIEGRLNLTGAEVPGSLWFYRCRFDAPVVLDNAQVRGSVTFGGCQLKGLIAEGCRIGADLVLHAGTAIADELRLTRARIGGDLDASRLDLSGGPDAAPSRRALQANALQVGGNLLLIDDFQSIGEVRLIGAQVQGDMRISGRVNGNALPELGRSAALVMDRIAVAGSLRLGPDFGAAGSVSLRRAQIEGDLDASGANFDWLGDASWGVAASLVLDRARIGGALVLRELGTPLLGASLVGTRVSTLVDDTTSWGEHLALDGFDYSRLDAESPLDTVFRIGWLERQRPKHLHQQFRMQPWGRLIRVLRRMGHEHRAGSIAQRREHWLRRIGRVGAWAPPSLRWLPRGGHWLLGLLAGHGHRPGRLLGWLLAVWLLCGAAYWLAAELGSAGAPGGFSPFAYSLERLLPLVALGQPEPGPAWHGLMRWLGHAEAVFGWVALLLGLASVAGWMDRDRRR